MKTIIAALACLLIPPPIAGVKVITETFAPYQYVGQTDGSGTGNRTVADGTLDYAGTSGNTAHSAPTSAGNTVTMTGADCDPYEGTGTVPLEVTLTGSVGYSPPPPETGRILGFFWRVAAGYTLDVTYTAGMSVSTITLSRPDEVIPEVWNESLAQHNGNLDSVRFDLWIDADLTTGIENWSTNANCYATWLGVTGNYSLVVKR
jgi:hypothetical protein